MSDIWSLCARAFIDSRRQKARLLNICAWHHRCNGTFVPTKMQLTWSKGAVRFDPIFQRRRLRVGLAIELSARLAKVPRSSNMKHHSWLYGLRLSCQDLNGSYSFITKDVPYIKTCFCFAFQTGLRASTNTHPLTVWPGSVSLFAII